MMTMTTRTKLKLLGILALAIAAIVMIVQNSEMTSFQLLFFPVKMPLAAMIFFSILIGFGLGLLVAFLIARRQKQAPPSA